MDRITRAQIKFIRSLQQKKHRDETGLFIAEGRKCIEELAKGFEMVLCVEPEDHCMFSEKQGMHVRASAKEIEQTSGLKSPQGMIAVFKKRQLPDNGRGEEQLVLCLDGIQDPGNLGTIIRTCDWFGVHDIYCSPDTADCYNPKVVQATMGALTRVCVHYTDLTEWLKGENAAVYGTLLDGRNMYQMLTKEHDLPTKRSVIIMGNEGNGISEAVRKFITHPIRIPSYPENAETSESLNVAIATSIVLAAFRQQKVN